MEDVTTQQTDDEAIKDLLGEEPQAEETPPEQRRRVCAEHDKALAKIQECEKALTDAKRAAGETAKELQGLTERDIPLHELNRRAQEVNRAEDEQRIATQEAIRVLNAGRRPGVQTRPPLFQTGAQKEE